jgi:SOS response regulatory protein OraA/RecX
LELKLKTLASSAPEQRKAKLIRFAASRGYDMDIVYQLVNQLLNMSEL